MDVEPAAVSPAFSHMTLKGEDAIGSRRMEPWFPKWSGAARASLWQDYGLHFRKVDRESKAIKGSCAEEGAFAELIVR
jgi:hypothetical protein